MTRSADARRRRIMMQMRAESSGIFGVLTAGPAASTAETIADSRRRAIEGLLDQMLAEVQTADDRTADDRTKLIRRYAALIDAAAVTSGS